MGAQGVGKEQKLFLGERKEAVRSAAPCLGSLALPSLSFPSCKVQIIPSSSTAQKPSPDGPSQLLLLLSPSPPLCRPPGCAHLLLLPGSHPLGQTPSPGVSKQVVPGQEPGYWLLSPCPL